MTRFGYYKGIQSIWVLARRAIQCAFRDVKKGPPLNGRGKIRLAREQRSKVEWIFLFIFRVVARSLSVQQGHPTPNYNIFARLIFIPFGYFWSTRLAKKRDSRVFSENSSNKRN